ncbi:hypothetical protein [Streptomyces botrytidirepellens]|uniref:Transposase n=1 Tax=Streptomyces botrytidirepellens TaxID=2486417 RepID=A0A3M8VVC4_9ACTN|nr:hypothetical protein [Streptomyces botrytidirepellens]RNG21626.1 hypothetical protein EEJ42_22235 [Streptomyces botrytidirepellens]
MELTDPGFDHSVPCEFRERLIDGEAGQLVLDGVLEAVRDAGLLKAGGRARTDSTHIVAAARDFTRLECVIETLRAALNALALTAPEWLQRHVEPAWFDRYAARPDPQASLRLPRPESHWPPR